MQSSVRRLTKKKSTSNPSKTQAKYKQLVQELNDANNAVASAQEQLKKEAEEQALNKERIAVQENKLKEQEVGITLERIHHAKLLRKN